MGNRLSAVSLKACRLAPDRVRDNTRLESFCGVLPNHQLTSRLVLKRSSPALQGISCIEGMRGDCDTGGCVAPASRSDESQS